MTELGESCRSQAVRVYIYILEISLGCVFSEKPLG